MAKILLAGAILVTAPLLGSASEPDWNATYTSLYREEFTSFRAPQTGDWINIERRIGSNVDGIITAWSSNSISVNDRAYTLAQITPKSAAQIFPAQYAESRALYRINILRADHKKKKDAEAASRAHQDRLVQQASHVREVDEFITLKLAEQEAEQKTLAQLEQQPRQPNTTRREQRATAISVNTAHPTASELAIQHSLLQLGDTRLPVTAVMTQRPPRVQWTPPEPDTSTNASASSRKHVIPFYSQSVFSHNPDGTASRDLLNVVEGRWGQGRGYVPAEGAGIIYEFSRGFGRGAVSVAKTLSSIFGLHSSKSSLDYFQAEHYHWRVSPRKSFFENLSNRAGALWAILTPLWLAFMPKALAAMVRLITDVSIKTPKVFRRIRSRTTLHQRLVVAIACPPAMILAGIGLMSALNIDHTDISENWWCWMLLVILIGLFEYFWFAPTTTTAGNSESDLDSRP